MMNDRIYYSREAEARAMRERTAAVVAFMALGVLVGAIVALLLAPTSGKTIRRQLADTFEDTFEDGVESTVATVQRLERDFRELRKKVESRLGD